MPKFPKNHKDVEYYVPGKKRRVAGSTRATSDFLAIVHNDNPTATIAQLYALLTDRTKFLRDQEAIEVLEAHIAAGYGDHIPDWRY